MTGGGARRWLFLALMLASAVPYFAILLVLLHYFAPDALFGWPWSDGLMTALGSLLLIGGPLAIVGRLAAFAGRRRRNLAMVLVSSVVLTGIFLPASFYLHVEVGSRDPEGSCDEYFTSTSRCLGRDWSMLQARRWIVRGKGVPRRELCEAFLRAPPAVADSNVCGLDDPARWTMADCARYGAPGDWHCRFCDRVTDAGDVYRTFISFERTCGHAMVAKSAYEQITVSAGDMDPRPSVSP